MSTGRHLRTLSAYIAKAGGTVTRIDAGRKHFKIRFTAGNASLTYVASPSPSDQRGLMNARAQIRRMVAEAKERVA